VNSGGAETPVANTSVAVSNPAYDTFGNAADVATILNNQAGDYVMRFIRDSKVLAEGHFSLH
jgi:hypothetical protein